MGKHKVTLRAGQRTEVTEPAVTPTLAAPLTAQDRQEWIQEKEWAQERAQEIQLNLEPELPPSEPAEEQPEEQPEGQPEEQLEGQPPQPVGEESQLEESSNVIEVINEAIEEVEETAPRVVSASALNDAVTVTLSEEVSSVKMDTTGGDGSPEVTLASGETYKIGIWDSNHDSFLSLTGIQESGTTVILSASGAQAEKQYIAGVYTGSIGQPDFTEVAASDSFTFLFTESNHSFTENNNSGLSAFTVGGQDVLGLAGVEVADPSNDPGATLQAVTFSNFKGIAATAADANGTVTITLNGAPVLDPANQEITENDVIVVTVAARDGMTAKFYKITVGITP